MNQLKKHLMKISKIDDLIYLKGSRNMELERLYKSNKYTHKRIWQVGMIMYVRLKVLKDKKPKEFKLSERYFKFLGKRTKIKGEKERKEFVFKL